MMSFVGVGSNTLKNTILSEAETLNGSDDGLTLQGNLSWYYLTIRYLI